MPAHQKAICNGKVNNRQIMSSTPTQIAFCVKPCFEYHHSPDGLRWTDWLVHRVRCGRAQAWVLLRTYCDRTLCGLWFQGVELSSESVDALWLNMHAPQLYDFCSKQDKASTTRSAKHTRKLPLPKSKTISCSVKWRKYIFRNNDWLQKLLLQPTVFENDKNK